MIRKLPLSLLAVAALISLAGAASAKVGVASAVEGAPRGLPPAGVERVLRVGIDMDADEKVTTGNDDRAHLVFLDGSSVSIGPNSVLVIDKFVFDADHKTGDMALTMSRGTMRFVGGVISKTSEVTVKTPSAILGIRGGIFTLIVSATGQVQFNFLFGISYSVASQGVTRTSSQPGTRVTVAPGAAPSTPALIPSGGLTAGVASFQRRGPPAAGAGGQRTGILVRLALADGRLGRSNSGLNPIAARAGTPTAQQMAILLSTPRRDGGPGGPGGGQLGQRGGAGPALPPVPRAVAEAIASGDSAAVAAALASASPALAAAITAALVSSNNATLVAATLAASSPTVAASIATAVVASNNAALITSVVVAAGTNAAVVSAVGTALGNSGNAALITAVTASVTVAAPAAAGVMTAAVIVAAPTLLAAVVFGQNQARNTNTVVVFNPNQSGSSN